MSIKPVLYALAGTGCNHQYDLRADIAWPALRCAAAGLIAWHSPGLIALVDEPPQPLDSAAAIAALAKQQRPLDAAYIPSLAPVYETDRPDFRKYNISPLLKERLRNEFSGIGIIKILANPFSV